MKKVIFLLLTVFSSQLAISQFNSDDTYNTDLDPSGQPLGAKIFFSGHGIALAVDSEKRILQAGYKGNNIIVTRTFSDGSLDTTFNDDVHAFKGLGNYNLNEPVYVTCMAVDLIRQKIYVAGYSPGPITADNLSHAFILSLNYDGSLNTNFSSDGIAFIDMGSTSSSFEERIYSIGIQYIGLNAGKVVVAGLSGNESTGEQRHMVARFERNGQPDIAGFNNGSQVAAYAGEGFFLDMDISPSDEIALISTTNRIVKLTNEGKLDMAFNATDSPGIYPKDPSTEDEVNDVAFYPGGKIVAIMTLTSIPNDNGKTVRIIRLNKNAEPDTTFNYPDSPGYYETTIGYLDYSIHLLIDPYKNIIAVGSRYSGSPTLTAIKLSKDGSELYNGDMNGATSQAPENVLIAPDGTMMVSATCFVYINDNSTPYAIISKVLLKNVHTEFLDDFITPKYIGNTFLLPESYTYLNDISSAKYPVVYSTNRPAKLRINGRLATARDSGIVAIRAYIPEDTFYYAYTDTTYVQIKADPPAIIIGPTTVPQGKEDVYTYSIKPNTLNGRWHLDQYGSNPDRLNDFTRIGEDDFTPTIKYYLEEDFPGGILKYSYVDPDTDEPIEILANIIPRAVTEEYFELKKLTCTQELVSCAGNYVDIFRINTLTNDSSGCSMGGYGNYLNTGFSTQLLLNENYAVTIGVRSTTNTFNFVGLYLDYNNDGSFSGIDEFISGGPVKTNEVTTFNIRIRNDKNFVGTRLLRVRTRANTELGFSDGCQVEGELGETEDYQISIQERDRLQGAHVLTPNNDGKNDFFTIRGINSEFGNRLTVVNRMGEVKYFRDNYNNDWDGTDGNGTQLKQGTYYYIFTNGDDSIKGFFELLY